MTTNIVVRNKMEHDQHVVAHTQERFSLFSNRWMDRTMDLVQLIVEYRKTQVGTTFKPMYRRRRHRRRHRHCHVLWLCSEERLFQISQEATKSSHLSTSTRCVCVNPCHGREWFTHFRVE